MTGPKDREERITAFIDGSLERDDLAAFEAELERDPALATEVERLMATDVLLREAFDAPMAEEVDDELLARMGLLPGQSGTADLSRHRRLAAAANDNRPFFARWAMPLGGAVAAALALAVVFGNPGGGGSGLGDALENTRSGQQVALANGAELTPVLTFAAGDGSYCREFAIAGADAAGGSGIACRREDGWKIEALEDGAAPLADPGEIALAAGRDGSGLDETFTRLRAGDPLGADAEAHLIARNWADR